MSPLADGALWHQGEGWEGESKGPCPTQGARVLISGPGRDTGLQSVGHGCCVQDGQASASSQVSLGHVQPVEASVQFGGKSPQLWGLLGMIGRGGAQLMCS